MAERSKIEERQEIYSISTRNLIRQKSCNLCSRCGKPLIDDFTIEHVIPLSKGGTNDVSNLIGLCKTCNKDKGNLVVHPRGYYPYLLDNYLNELIESQKKYYDDFEWISEDALLPSDIVELKTMIIPRGFDLDMVMSLPQKRRKKYYAVTSIFLKKAYYQNLDSLYDFCMQVINVDLLGLEGAKAYAKKQLSDYFDNGVIYYLEDKYGEIKGVIPLKFVPYRKNLLEEGFGDDKQNGVLPYIAYPIMKYSDMNYSAVLYRVYTYILSWLSKGLNKPIYYCAESDLSNQSLLIAFMCLMQTSDKVHGLDVYSSKDKSGLMFTGIWSSTDTAFIHEVQSQDIVNSFSHTDIKEPVYLHKYSVLEHKTGKGDDYTLGEFNLDEFKDNMEVFAKNLARKLGYRSESTKIEVTKYKSKDSYSVETFNIDDILVPEFYNIKNSSTKLSKLVENQIKYGSLRPLHIDTFGVINTEDIPILLYLKKLGYKEVSCYRRNNKLALMFDNLGEDVSDDAKKYLRELYYIKDVKPVCSNYVNYKIVYSQKCHCKICGAEFTMKNKAYPRVTVYNPDNSLYDESNVALCSKCDDLAGRIRYSSELRTAIRMEYELESSDKVCVD